MLSIKIYIEPKILRLGARGGTRTPTSFRTADFKSAASTIPPPGLVCETTKFTRGHNESQSKLRIGLGMAFIFCRDFCHDRLNAQKMGSLIGAYVAKKYTNHFTLV